MNYLVPSLEIEDGVVSSQENIFQVVQETFHNVTILLVAISRHTFTQFSNDSLAKGGVL